MTETNSKKDKFYKRWWFWVIIATATAALVGIALLLLVGSNVAKGDAADSESKEYEYAEVAYDKDNELWIAELSDTFIMAVSSNYIRPFTDYSSDLFKPDYGNEYVAFYVMFYNKSEERKEEVYDDLFSLYDNSDNIIAIQKSYVSDDRLPGEGVLNSLEYASGWVIFEIGKTQKIDGLYLSYIGPYDFENHKLYYPMAKIDLLP